MSHLKDLYNRKTSFNEYRSEAEEFEYSADNPTNDLYAERDKLRAELKLVTTRINARLSEIDFKMLEAGVPKSKSDRKRAFDIRMRDERKQADKAFQAEVVASQERGLSVPDMMEDCGAPNGAVFYNALRAVKANEFPTDSTEHVNMDDIEWRYSDHTGVHRYAISTDGAFAKFHDVDLENKTYTVLTVPGFVHYSGDRALAEKFDPARYTMLHEILEGVYSGPVREAANPYK